MPRSPRQVRKNLQEAVTEQVRDLPVHAVRLAMFGVGRALLLSDRVTRDYRQIRESGVGPVLTRLKGDAEKVAGKVVSRVSGQHNGHDTTIEVVDEIPVARPPRKVNTSLSADGETAVDGQMGVDGEMAAGKAVPVIEPVVTEAAPEPEPEVTLPVPDYDSATLASVRARLRALSAGQVQELLVYEAAHAARPDFIRMFENRIAKLAEG